MKTTSYLKLNNRLIQIVNKIFYSRYIQFTAIIKAIIWLLLALSLGFSSLYLIDKKSFSIEMVQHYDFTSIFIVLLITSIIEVFYFKNKNISNPLLAQKINIALIFICIISIVFLFSAKSTSSAFKDFATLYVGVEFYILAFYSYLISLLLLKHYDFWSSSKHIPSTSTTT